MMPSASSNTKLEKQVSGTPAESTSDNNNATNPMKQTLVTIEHKIRNLEKRKTKLESYRAIQASGKELSADQKAAVAKYDAVTHTLEFVRDLSKQMIQFSKDAEKEQKKQARKDAIIKAQTETNKIREVLVIQNILANLTVADIREAFLTGENGAAKLELADIENLEKFNMDIIVNRPEQSDDAPFLNVAQKAAEYLSMTIDGRPKQYGETTFENLKRIFQQIQECGFLDKVHFVGQPDAVEEPVVVEEVNAELQQQQPDEEPNANDEGCSDDVAADEIPQQSQQEQQLQTMKPPSTYEGNSSIVDNVFVVESAEVAPVYPAQQIHNQMPPQSTPPPTSGITAAHSSQQPQQQQQQHQPIPRQVVPSPVNMQQPAVAAMPQAVTAVATPVPAHFPATTVRAVEEAYFKHQQYLQQMRPLAEVIGAAKIYFLQDSEVDSPDLAATTFGGNPNEVQTQCTNVFNQHQAQPPTTPQQQQQQHQMQLVQSPVVQQQQQQQQQPTHSSQQPPQHPLPKGAHVNMAAPIPTQTFTNQSFPPIVQAPTTLYPVAANSVATSLQSPLSCVPTEKQQMGQAVFSPAVNASPAILSVQHQMIAATNHQPPLDQQHPGAVVMMNRVNIAGYQQYDSSPVTTAPVQVLTPSSAITQPTDPYHESIEVSKDETILSSTEEANTTPSSEWESNDREDRRRDNSQTKGINQIETNQWSSEMNSAALFNSNSGGGGNQSDSSSTANSNSRKNEWSDENHHQGRQESNHWSSTSHQNDGYAGGRSRHNYNRSDQRGRDGGRSNNGMDRMDRGAMRGGNVGSSMGGGYRGRNNYPTSQSQQNGGGRGGGVYFRNNDNSYYHNSQNGNSNNAGGSNNGGSGGGYNKEGGNGQRYDNTNNYRSRGGNNNASNSGNNSRNNSNSNNGNHTRSSMSSMSGGGGGGMNGPRTGGARTSGGGGGGGGGGSSTYVNSRQQPNPRQPQDVA